MRHLAAAFLALAIGWWTAGPAAGQLVHTPPETEVTGAAAPARIIVFAEQPHALALSQHAAGAGLIGERDSLSSISMDGRPYRVWGAVGASSVMDPGPASVTRLAAAGAAGAVAGSFGGALVGYHLDRQLFGWDGGDDPGIVGAVGGWFIGSALLTPLAVYLANGRRGSLSSSYQASGLIAGAGWLGVMATGSPGGVVFIVGAPIAQVVSATTIQRRGSR
jgi:hypothetical protein